MASSTSISGHAQPHHVVLFPFMSKGHIIPVLHLARLLLHRRLAVTTFTTLTNRPFISESLKDTTASIVDLPFSHNVPDIPVDIDTTENLPSMSLFHSFANATKVIPTSNKHSILFRVSFMVSDAFLWWIQESASKFNTPRLVYYGMSYYSKFVVTAVVHDRLLFGPESDDELIRVTRFPWIKVTINEPNNNKPTWWVQWLDKKFDQGNSVLYIACGSQAEISSAQLKEIENGLEESKVNFLWVIRKSESEISDGFEERVKGRSRMVVEEIKVGLRVETCNGSVKGFVKWEGLEKMLKELMEGEKGKEVRKKCKEVAEKAKKAMGKGGSSKCTLDLLIDEICGKNT